MGAIRADEAFPHLVQQVAAQELASLSDNERKAFLINAYNILVIKGVIDHYPIGSVQDVAGFFDRKRYVVAGQASGRISPTPPSALPTPPSELRTSTKQ